MLLKKGKFVILLVSLILSLPVYGQLGNSFKYHFDGNLKSVCIVSPDHSLTINYSVSELDIQSFANSSGVYYRISIPGHNSSSETGKPELPVFSRLITIPENSRAVVSIHDVRYQKISPSQNNFKGLLYPRQEGLTKNDRQKNVFIIDKAAYANKGLLSSDTVKIENIGKIRKNQLAAVYITPVRYNPLLNELEVITSMRIDIDFKQSGAKSVTSSLPESPVIAQSLAKGTLNYYPSDYITGYSTSPVGMIILTDTAFRMNLKPFIKWKTEEGFKVKTIYKGTWPAGNSFAGIKDSLTRIYNSGTEENPAPEYLLIVGDVNKIPLSEGTSQVSDLYYGEFDGNGDYIPDMFIGRLPVADTTELKNVVGKLLQYEKFQVADSNTFYNRAIVTAGDDGGYYDYMNGQVKYAASNYINSNNGIEGHIFYYPNSASAEDTIKKLINSGVSFINYSGHGEIDGWIDPALRVTDVPLFQNKNMYPFVITNACQTAHFNYAASFGNKMIISPDKGAIGYIGCSNDSYWDEDYYWSVGVGTISSDPQYSEKGLGAYDRLFHLNNENPSNWYITMGQVNFAGNLSVSSSTSTLKKYYWETYTLLGDPSLIPIIGKPDSFSIQIPVVLPNGITSLSLITDPFAYAAVSVRDSLIDASYASPDGSLVLKLPGLSNDSCLFVATGQNRIPLIKKITFGEVNDEFINLTSSSVNDSTGNNNGKADYNESFWLSLKIDNLGLKNADSLYAKITTNSDLVKIITDSVYIGSLNGKSSALLSRAMALKVADSVPDKASIPFDLIVKDRKTVKRYRIDIIVHAPDISILSCYIDDTGIGNGDYIPEPGETVNLIFRVANSGSSPATGIFQISCPQTGITIVPPGNKSGVIGSGETVTYTMPVSFSESIPLGEYFSVNSLMNCTPYDKSKDFEFRIGKARENFEVQSFDVFPWINISSNPWVITDKDAYDGLYSAMSGQITNNQSTSLIIKAYLSVPDSLRFYCKVSSEQYYDFLSFVINDNTVFRMSGESGWQRKTVALPQGLDKIEWIYSKDESVSAGYDCAWLDLIDFPDPSEVVFIQRDLSVDRVISPLQSSDFLNDSVSVSVTNQGKDPMNGFNLAYSINNVPVGYEHFTNILNSYLDSTTVWFTQKPDLSKYDYYDLKVYSINNNEDYHLNDTAETKIENIKIVEPFKAFPNPFNDQFRITINAKVPDDVTVTLTNSSGIIIKSYKTSITEGENNIDIDCPDLASGYYFLTVKGRTMKSTSPMIKVN
jgi:Peptidase family C25/Propeptide_C25/Secretion system C-terminal sorting domain/Peptidase family C25, C terminal ig-like domain